jgi:segregation and condensation protein B
MTADADANAVSPAPAGDVHEIKAILEAALLTAGEPLPIGALARLFDPALDTETVQGALDALAADWKGRQVDLVHVASGWRFQGKGAIQPYLDRLVPEKPPRYSRAVMETLAIIAYKQPVTRGDIEAIRGVAVSTYVVKTLEDRQWVEVVGHRETPGRPALYATTKTFLDDLGLTSLSELPPLAELDASHLPEIPDAPKQAAEAQLEFAAALLAPSADATAPRVEPGAAAHHREPDAAAPPLVH